MKVIEINLDELPCVIRLRGRNGEVVEYEAIRKRDGLGMALNKVKEQIRSFFRRR